MGADREIQLTWKPRTVVVEDHEGPADTLTYPGIEITRRRGGCHVDEV